MDPKPTQYVSTRMFIGFSEESGFNRLQMIFICGRYMEYRLVANSGGLEILFVATVSSDMVPTPVWNVPT